MAVLYDLPACRYIYSLCIQYSGTAAKHLPIYFSSLRMIKCFFSIFNVYHKTRITLAVVNI